MTITERHGTTGIYIVPSKSDMTTLAVGSSNTDAAPTLITPFYYMHGGQLGFSNVDPMRDAATILGDTNNYCQHICAVFERSGWNETVENDKGLSDVAFANLKFSSNSAMFSNLSSAPNLISFSFSIKVYTGTESSTSRNVFMDPFGLVRVLTSSSTVGSGWYTSYAGYWQKTQKAVSAITGRFADSPVALNIANIYDPYNYWTNVSSYYRQYPQFGCTPWNPMVKASYSVIWINENGTKVPTDTGSMSSHSNLSDFERHQISRWNVYEDVNIWPTMWNGQTTDGSAPTDTFKEWFDRSDYATQLYLKNRSTLSHQPLVQYFRTMPPTDPEPSGSIYYIYANASESGNDYVQLYPSSTAANQGIPFKSGSSTERFTNRNYNYHINGVQQSNGKYWCAYYTSTFPSINHEIQFYRTRPTTLIGTTRLRQSRGIPWGLSK